MHLERGYEGQQSLKAVRQSGYQTISADLSPESPYHSEAITHLNLFKKHHPHLAERFQAGLVRVHKIGGEWSDFSPYFARHSGFLGHFQYPQENGFENYYPEEDGQIFFSLHELPQRLRFADLSENGKERLHRERIQPRISIIETPDGIFVPVFSFTQVVFRK